MRTVHYQRTPASEPGWIESTSEPHRWGSSCSLCTREEPAAVRRIEYSANGRQSYPLSVCADCKPLLIDHLNAED